MKGKSDEVVVEMETSVPFEKQPNKNEFSKVVINWVLFDRTERKQKSIEVAIITTL